MHIPVLVNEVIEYLHPRPNQNFIDGTCGAAGHTLAILEKNAPAGRVMCLDWDNFALLRVKENIALKDAEWLKRAILVNDSYANLLVIAEKQNFRPVRGILLDLGLSLDQLEKSGRGFSFQKDEPLDMRYSVDQNLTAREIVNHWDKFALQEILRDFGEESFARKISERIIESRKIKPILTTADLVAVVAKAIPRQYQHGGRIHFATRTFQALRIAVNDELGNLEKFLPQAVDILEKEGKLAVISFHSLEDRIVKNFFRNSAKDGKVEILTKKPITAKGDELSENPRSRSAKLRVIKKIS